jgi:F-type H+-transporting ATPase subunit b
MENLGLDIKIFVAQIINFVLLFFIFRKLVYKPFLNTLKTEEDREKKALGKIEEYEKKEKELYKTKLALEDEYEEKLKRIYAKMKKETNEAKRQILKEAQIEAEELRKHNLELIESDKQKMLADVKKEATEIALVIAEKALSETLTPALQKQITKDIANKLPKAS